MYKSYTADDWRENLGLDPGYTINGFIVFGTYQKSLYQMVKNSLKRAGLDVKYRVFKDEFLEPILEFTIDGKRYWFVIVYGGALLSEFLHLACLFGSKKNILLGTCSGLKKGASSLEFMVPEWSFAKESSAKGYQPDTGYRYKANTELSGRIAEELGARGCVVHRDPTITYQAMLSETWDDVVAWSEEGYGGVEMEAATVFAVSNHFEVPSAAILRIGDNLIGSDPLVKSDMKEARSLRRKVSQEALDIALNELIH